MIRRIKYATVATIFVLLTGCSALGTLLGKPGVNVNAQAGKENVQQIVGQQDRTTIEADSNSSVVSTPVKGGSGVAAKDIRSAKSNRSVKSVGGSLEVEKAKNVKQQTSERINDIRTGEKSTVNINSEVPVWVWFMMILGWMLPDPGRIWTMLKELNHRRKVSRLLTKV